MRHRLISFAVTAILVLGAISVFGGANSAAQLSKAGAHVLGNGTGALVVGVPEFAVGYREVVNSGDVQSYVSNYPKLKEPTSAQQLREARAEAKKANDRIAKLKRDLAAAKKNQP